MIQISGNGRPRQRPVELKEALVCLLRLFRRRRPKLATSFIPVIRLLSQTTGAVPKTPQYRRFPLYGGALIMAVEMTTIDQFEVTIAPKNAKGQPAPVDGAPTWLADNTDVVSLEPSADGMSCLVKAVGIAGGSMVQVTADADMGSGVVAIVGTLQVNVTPAQATTIVLTPGPVVVQP